ncbi:MAG: MarR family transcriptional regulator [Moraxellaceae bacterium]|nr:MarR family transcriptional regulator [Moraxellaceae bacterium]MDZ4386338.1 MarR family transcriptional regulator [Moraxellaceae bacterium]
MSSTKKEASGEQSKSLHAALKSRLNEAMRIQSTETVMLHTVLAGRLGLNATDHKALDIVMRRGPLTAGQIADYTGLTTGAVTGVINRLEKVGMARRSADKKDRRRVVIEVAPEAFGKLEPLFLSLNQSMETLASQYSNSDLELICTFIERCTRIVEQENIYLRQE